MEDENYYVTSDLALATVISLQFPIGKLDKKNPKKVLFYFEKDKEGKIDDLIEKYWKKMIKVEPQSFFYQIRTIKNIIYEG
jgi:hypothetical protein